MSVVEEHPNMERVKQSLEHGAPHLRPVLKAMREGFCAFVFIPRGEFKFCLPKDKGPVIYLLGDDLRDACGPWGFHRPSIRRALAETTLAVIVASAPDPRPYAIAACAAMMSAVLPRDGARAPRDVLIVETRPEQEQAWEDFIWRERPGLQLVLCTTPPEER